MKRRFLAIGIVIAVNLSGATAPAAWTPEQTQLFEGVADEYIHFSDGAGAVLGIASGAEPPLLVAGGLANIANQTPLTTQHVFRIGSISKTFVACTILQLVEEGKLSLDDLLSQWYPDYPNAEKVTVRMLLNMTTGFRDFLEVTITDFNKTWTPEELIALSLTEPAYFEPGAAWAYSNTNYIFLARIIEKITGNKISAELRMRIFDKVGLAHTWFDGEETVTGPLPRGYIHVYGALADYTYYLNASLAWAAGAIVSSGDDLIVYLRALFDGTLLSQDSIAKMIDFIHVNGVPVYGLGVMHSDTVIGAAWGHNGSTGEFMSLLLYVPDKSLYVTVLNNSDNYDQEVLADEALLVATGAPTFKPKNCQPPGDFLKVGDNENRLAVKFRGFINESDPAPAYYRMGFGYAQFDRYGAIFDTNTCGDHAYHTVDNGGELINIQSNCWEAGRYNPTGLTGRMGRITVPRALLEAAKTAGTNEITPDDRTLVEIWDVEYDTTKGAVTKQCFQAHLDRTGTSKLYVCHDQSTQFTAGEEIAVWASAALDTNIPVDRQCTCLNEQTGNYDPCPVEQPDAGTPDAGGDAGTDTGTPDTGGPDTGVPDSGFDGGIQTQDGGGMDGSDDRLSDTGGASDAAAPEGEAGGCGCTTVGI